MVLLFLSQIQIGRAFHQEYTWQPGGYPQNGYTISLIGSDNWQVDTKIDITFRLLMTYKNYALDHTETNKVKITLTSENFIIDSGDLLETRILSEVGDYWDKTISFNIPAEKVSRGQTLDVAITFLLTITQAANALGGYSRLAYTKQNLDNPIHVSLFRPFLSMFELIVVIVVAIIVVGGLGGFIFYRIFYRRKRVSAKPPSPPSMQ